MLSSLKGPTVDGRASFEAAALQHRVHCGNDVNVDRVAAAVHIYFATVICGICKLIAAAAAPAFSFTSLAVAKASAILPLL